MDSIKNEFLDIYKALPNLSDDEILNGPDDIFRPHLERINQLTAMDVSDYAAEKILQDVEFQIIIKIISHIKRINGLRMEIENARLIISESDPYALLKDFIYYPNYLKLADMEYQGGNLKSGDRVVFLGSGPLPMSLILLSKQYNIEGIGIEQSPEYAALSQKLIKSLDLSAHIRIIQGNHFLLPLKHKCNLIMIGADALPKDEIFNHLARVLLKGTKLSYRIYEKGLRRFLDNRSVFKLPDEFKEYARIRPEPPVNNTSVFVIKDNEL
ncbi:histidine 2-aminobutanoyltransferase [Candidatus Magnetomoraceae bacterium gMMP-15]